MEVTLVLQVVVMDFSKMVQNAPHVQTTAKLAQVPTHAMSAVPDLFY